MWCPFETEPQQLIATTTKMREREKEKEKENTELFLLIMRSDSSFGIFRVDTGFQSLVNLQLD